jgi:outer membrane protein TolC
MRHIHEPSDEFVATLEREISRDIRRRHQPVPWPHWLPQTRMAATLALIVLMVASMGIGAAAMAAGYAAQSSERRNQLTTSYEQRADLARQRLVVANDELKAAERQVSVGMAGTMGVFEGRMKVAEAEAQLASLQLQLEEIRITRLEPRNELSAPRVSGRDFVTERLRLDMSVPQAALLVEHERQREAEKRFQVGMADGFDVASAQARVVEVEAAIDTFRRKLDIRQRFLAGSVDAVEAELRVLEAEAEQRTTSLRPKIDLARKEIQRITGRVDVGTATNVQLSEATLRRLQLETDLAKADLDLTLVRRQIAQHRSGR